MTEISFTSLVGAKMSSLSGASYRTPIELMVGATVNHFTLIGQQIVKI